MSADDGVAHIAARPADRRVRARHRDGDRDRAAARGGDPARTLPTPRSTTAILATTLGAEHRSAHAHTSGANAESSTAPLTPLVTRAADLFLAGYLGYIYGHAPASAIDGATPALLRSLRAQPTRVSPGMRARQPHVLALRSTPARSGPLLVNAVINDGGLVDYSIGLLLAVHGGRLLVSGLEGGE